MHSRETLIRMLKQLLEDMQALHQLGAGYFSCTPIAKRYNKLLAKASVVCPEATELLETFEAIAEQDPKDPADKMKVVQSVRIEANQLISLLESVQEDVS